MYSTPVAAAVFLVHNPRPPHDRHSLSKLILFFQRVYRSPVTAAVFLAYTIPAYLLAGITIQN